MTAARNSKSRPQRSSSPKGKKPGVSGSASGPSRRSSSSEKTGPKGKKVVRRYGTDAPGSPKPSRKEPVATKRAGSATRVPSGSKRTGRSEATANTRTSFSDFKKSGSDRQERRPRRESDRPSRPHSDRPVKRAGKGELRQDREELKAALKRTRSVFDRTALERDSQNDDSFRGHRLQKVLAAAGFGSRRQCEELITTGRVDVNGKVVTELGVRVFPISQRIRVDGEELRGMKPVYVVVNKPRGILCTNRDQQGRPRAIDLLPPSLGRLFPVGRLDRDSEGLLLMTNDGNLAMRLTHPRYEVPKKYRVQVAGLVEPDLIHDLKKGVHLAEAVVQADDVVLKSRHKLSSILEITLKEGKNREIRRMLARVGHKVMHLQRVAIGPVKLGKMLPGEYRPLSQHEITQLYKAAELTETKKPTK